MKPILSGTQLFALTYTSLFSCGDVLWAFPD
jgi:hypothetical protein